MAAADEDGEETEDECADKHIETDSDDECDDDPHASTPSVIRGTLRDVQEPRGQDVGDVPREGYQFLEVASQQSSPSVAEGASDRGLATVKTECRLLPCAAPGPKAVAPSTGDIDPASSGSAVSGDGTPSPPSLNAAPGVKNEGSFSPPRTPVSPEAPELPAGFPSSRVRYTHQLFSPCELCRWECLSLEGTKAVLEQSRFLLRAVDGSTLCLYHLW